MTLSGLASASPGSASGRSRSRRAAAPGWILAALTTVAAISVRPAFAATTYHVEKTNASCSNSGPGTTATPFCSIAPAASRAVAGDFVLVGPGTYSEVVTPKNSGTSAGPITYQTSGAVVRGGKRGFAIFTRSWIVIRGFEVKETTGAGIYVSSSTFITIENNHVHHVGQPVADKTAKGIQLTGTSDSLVSGNVVDHASDSGIYVSGSSSRVTVRANRSTSNARGYTRAAAGFDVRNSNGILLEANRSSKNEDSGYNVWDSSNVVVRNNVAERNGDHGIDNLRSTGTAITSNTVYGGVDSGIEVVGAANGVKLANNISVDNGINSPRTTGNVRVDGTAAKSVALDFDLLWLSAAGDVVVWSGTKYKTLAAFVAATGKESHGKSANPRFVNAGAGDFRLLAGSPAIDSANSDASGQTATDADGLARIDDPATPNTGIGTRRYDDLGAYEFQP